MFGGGGASVCNKIRQRARFAAVALSANKVLQTSQINAKVMPQTNRRETIKILWVNVNWWLVDLFVCGDTFWSREFRDFFFIILSVNENLPNKQAYWFANVRGATCLRQRQPELGRDNRKSDLTREGGRLINHFLPAGCYHWQRVITRWRSTIGVIYLDWQTSM